MIKKITSLSTVALTVAFISGGAIAHSGKYLADGSGGKVVDGSGNCVLASSGTDACAPPAPAPTPAPAPVAAAPAPTPAPVIPEPPVRVVEKVSFSGDALFATNSATLTNAGKLTIDPIIAGSQDLNNFKISLFGHADSRGNDDYNMRLSERRAQAVADYMISKGVPASAISVYGRGETEPVASNATAEGRAQNRRVDATFSGENITFK